MKVTIPVDPYTVRYCPRCDIFGPPEVAACPDCYQETYFVHAIGSEDGYKLVWWSYNRDTAWTTIT